MKQRAMWLCGVSLGAVAAFLFDPTSGARRRRRIADVLSHTTQQTTRAVSAAGRNFRNRTLGVIATARHRRQLEQPDDIVLEERVHSALGHVMTRSHLITVRVSGGLVTLDGPIPEVQEMRVLHAVRAIPGVQDVKIRFNRHIQPARQVSRTEWGPTH